MVATNHTTLSHRSSHLTYADACRLADHAERGTHTQMIFLDLSQTEHTTTAALARLIQLRSALLRNGRDLRLTGLTGRTRGLYEIHRMAGLLPQSPPQSKPPTMHRVGHGGLLPKT